MTGFSIVFSDLFPALGHAITVHFAVTLFVISAVSYVVSISVDKYVIQYQSRLIARWSLWGASVTTIIAVVFGLFAFLLGRHDDASHLLLNMHRNVALFVGFVVIILTLWLAVLLRNDKEETKGFIFLHLVASTALLYVTWTGTVLVYQHGVGVDSLPDAQHHNHRTYEKASIDNSSFGVQKQNI